MNSKKKVSPTLSLILPLYNEEEHLEKSLAIIIFEMKRLGVSWEIIFVEDKSTDGTLRIVEEYVKRQNKMSLIIHKKNMGRGKSVKDGILAAKGEIVGFIDVDLEISPVFINSMIKPILQKQSDMTMGYRIYNVNLRNFIRFILSRGYVFLMQRILGLPFKDTEAGYKFFDAKKILPVLKKCRNQGWFFDTEIVARSYASKLKIREIPVLFIRNPQKTSTVSPLIDSAKYLFSLYQFQKQITPER